MTAPAGGSVRINGGAGSTAATSVTLTLAATGADEVRFSNDNNTWDNWEGYTACQGLDPGYLGRRRPQDGVRSVQGLCR